MISNPNKQVSTKFRSARKTVTGGPDRSEVKYGRKAATMSPVKRSGFLPTSDDTTSLFTGGGISEITKKIRSLKPVKIATNKSTGKDKQDKQNFHHSDTITSRMRVKAATQRRAMQEVAKRVYRPSSSKIFDYDLSKEEAHYYTHSRKPMKTVPSEELQLLKTGKRSTYLESRYAHSPDTKYNYPEATSWRYGWFHCINAAK